MSYVLRTYDLTKTYKNSNVVDKLNLNIEKGDIYGFLGKNGAGKTTTIKMILGIIKATNGKIELFENDILDSRRAYGRIGCLVESGFYLNLTAKENLEIHKRMSGFIAKDNVNSVLDMVGLKNVKNKKVKNFSLGMKQRLGIARAILHHPEFLILDEPTNGLDPMGIREMRELILDLNKKYGITILISSHILSEIQLLVNKVGIIHKGRLIEEVDYHELEKRNRHYIELKVDNDKKACFMLENKLNIKDYTVWDNNTVKIYERLSDTWEINKMLVNNDIKVYDMHLTADNLEDYFMRITGGRENV